MTFSCDSNKENGVRDWMIVISIAMLTFVVHISCTTVTYDSKSLFIDGKRRFMQSGAIHYPRSTPEMWPSIVKTAKDGGLDVIESYLFWSVHEPERETYNFEGSNDLIRFVKTVADAGLYMIIRMGPYVCAEWSFGGFPLWLRNIPDIEFRIANKPFYDEMERFVTKIVRMLQAENLFASQGGPIILSQIENEYSNIQDSFNDDRRTLAYVDWAANMAVDLEPDTPWFMCKQFKVPEPNLVIETCNGFYCDGYSPNPDQPKLWTENWAGWMTNWGQGRPQRPPEDIAFAVARFFQKGGSLQNYYMYHGGTNFGRWAGSYVTTSYDYDAPIDEYGKPNQPKWGHLKSLHAAIKRCEPALASSNRVGVPTADFKIEVDVYSNAYSMNFSNLGNSTNFCAAFLANLYDGINVTVVFNQQAYVLPPWSVTILPDCKTAVYNTGEVTAATTTVSFIPKTRPRHCEWYREPVGVWGSNGSTFKSTTLMEQLKVTNDKTDYLWYITSVNLLHPSAATLELDLRHGADTVHIFVNGAYAGRQSPSFNTMSVQKSISLNKGTNTISILCMTMGLQNFGAYYEKYGRGIEKVRLLGVSDFSNQEWTYQVGSEGEHLRLFTKEGAANVHWQRPVPMNQPLTWYKALIDSPAGSDPVALDLGSMGKGQAWINGYSIGRFWSIKNAAGDWGNCDQGCDYMGNFDPSQKCRSECEKPSQRWYHVPRAWLNPTDNYLVLYEEIGGDPTQVSLTIRKRL
ncbi:hypothetical protein Mapa_006490 [Marchantia paleacea]|nr:hypothetical protein Mapa_006490 [Marchantia paleacea]